MRSYIALCALGASFAASPALAQLAAPGDSRLLHVTGGGSGMYAQPVGEFRDHVNAGGGGEGHLLLRLDPAGAFALRVDGGFLIYGNERVRVRSPFGGRFDDFRVTTTNSIILAGVGPQLMVPSGPVRPYVNGTVGLAYFLTQSSVEGPSDNQPFAKSRNKGDANFAYTGGAGIYIPLVAGRRTVSLDLGARYHHNGTAEYLRKGGIRDLPDGGIEMTPIRSEANFVTYRLGVGVGF